MNKQKRLKVKELIEGEAYFGHGRNFNIAIWDGYYFHGLRYKFGDKFIDAELPHDADEHFGTFAPFRKLI